MKCIEFLPSGNIESKNENDKSGNEKEGIKQAHADMMAKSREK